MSLCYFLLLLYTILEKNPQEDDVKLDFRTFGQEAFLNEEESEHSQKGAEKEPKRSRNKEPKVGCKEIIDVIYVYVKENCSTIFCVFYKIILFSL